MLQLLAFTQAHSQAVDTPVAPRWTVDPAVPGADLPDQGVSLFDRVTTVEGRQQIPFPFERLIARIEAAAGCSAPRPCTRAVLIPLGRSLQRVAASPDFYRHPRVVAAVVSDGRGLLLRDRLYVGYQDKAGVIEVISYNEALGRFEFQIVKDYVAGRTPKVIYARRTVCVACHQNHGPIFPQQVWLETNANPEIAARLLQQQASFFGVGARGTTDTANAIDNATDRANQLALVQRLWIEGCGAGEAGAACRSAALTASLQLVLTGLRSYDASAAEFRQAAVTRLTTNARAHWPAGLAFPDPDIPNRDPLNLPATAGLAQAHVDVRFDPLLPRAPLEILPADGPVLADRLVKGIAGFWSDQRRDELARAIDTRAGGAPVRRIRAPCRVSGSEGMEQFECASSDSTSLRLRGALNRHTGTLDEIGAGSGEPVRHLQIESVRRQATGASTAATLIVRDQSRWARLPDGNSIEQIVLRWPSRNGNEGEAEVAIREDFAGLAKSVSAAAADLRPLRVSLIDEITARAQGVQPVSVPVERISAATDERAPGVDVHPLALLFESQCGSCHHTSEATPPNFLSGDSRRVSAALASCAPRIFVRMAMRDAPPDQRAKTPMPPELFLSPPPVTGGGQGGGRLPRQDEKSLAVLRAGMEAMLSKEYGRLPTLDELMRHGYESLRPCLPDSL